MSFSFPGRIGLAGAPHHDSVKRTVEKRACDLSAGDLYLYPNSSSTVDATSPVTFKWNTACDVATSTVDLYLYESSGLIKAWTGKTFADGEFTVTLQPKWWSDTTTAHLQMSIIDGGGYAWDTSSPAGPVFSVKYDASAMYATSTVNGKAVTSTAAAAATQSKDAVFENISSANSSDKSGISKGAIAAAVVVPLIVLAIIVGVAVRFWRMREAEKRKRWSQALSTHSNFGNMEWEKGALPGEKPGSILGRPSTGGGRPSTQFGRPSMSTYGGNGRPTSSMYAVENNMAGAGAGGGVHFRPEAGLRSVSADNLAASRSSVVMPDGQVRQSRISFAEHARPDRRSRLSFGGDIRPNTQSGVFRLPGASKSASELNRKSAAYATGSALDDEEEEINVSPSQRDGPRGFGEPEMRRMSSGQRTGRRSFMSLGGGDKRRESVASALSGDDFRSAASARGSMDELRDIEAMVLHRRSMISQASRSPNLDAAYDTNAVETLHDVEPMPMPLPSPGAGADAANMDPDQLLALYAAQRAKTNAAPSTPTFGARNLTAADAARPNPTRQNSGMKLFTSFGKKNAATSPAASSPGIAEDPSAIGPPVEMKSYVHLNSGTVSADVVNALPRPGPPGKVMSPTSEYPPNGGLAGLAPARDERKSGVSETSRYSEEAEGNAK